MLDRRQNFRGRVYYGGQVAFNGRKSTVDCTVRNVSPRGAKIEFAADVVLPDRVDLTIARKGVAYLATIKWQNGRECGVVFRNPTPVDEPMTLDVAMRQRALERANKSLRRQIEQLGGFA